MEKQKIDQPYASFETTGGNGKQTAETERRALGVVADTAKAAAQKGKQAAMTVGRTIKARPYLIGLLFLLFGGAFLARMFMKRA